MSEAGQWRRPGEERFSALPNKPQVTMSVCILRVVAMFLAALAVVLAWVAGGWWIALELKHLGMRGWVVPAMVLYAAGSAWLKSRFHL